MSAPPRTTAERVPEPGTPPIVFVLKGYPRLSETFIAQEVEALERLGLPITIVSLRAPTDPMHHPVHGRIRAAVHYLPEYLHDAPLRVIRSWWKIRRLAGYRAAKRLWLRDLRRDFNRNRVRRFGQALVLAAELDGMAPPGSPIRRLHAHFLHTPASVTRYAAHLRDLPWSCSAHAKDVWQTPEWEIREKLADMAWLTTCTSIGARHLASLAPEPEAVHLAYHGLSFADHPVNQRERGRPDGSSDAAAVSILCVGRAVPKKGIDILLHALAALPVRCHWTFTHIGGGSELKRLRDLAQILGIAGQVTWSGARAQDDVFAAYDAADIFVLPCRVAADGDRDGMPNVLMEAMSRGLCVLSTPVSAIPELVTDGETGALVPPDDAAALAERLETLIATPEDRLALGASGERHVREKFSTQPGLRILAPLFGLEPPLGQDASDIVGQEPGDAGCVLCATETT